MRHLLYLLPLYLLILCLSTGLQSCHDPEEPLAPDTVSRTVLLYVVAQNSLGANGFWRLDSTEIAAGTPAIPEGGRLLAFVDKGGEARLLEFTAKEQQPRTLHSWGGDVCSTNPETLQEVVLLTAKLAPALEYGLVMWSHADGWLPSTNRDYTRSIKGVGSFSFGIDVGKDGSPATDTSADGHTLGAQMDIDDMATAITNTGIHLRFIHFDACLMQSLETGYALREVTDYVVGCPISISPYGAYYTHQVEHGYFSNDPADIARTYYEDVRDPALASHYDDYGIVCAAVRTEALPALAAAIREALPQSLLASTSSPDMTGVQPYHKYIQTYYYRPHCYDALAALQRLLPQESLPRVEQALAAAVPYHAATERFWIGPGYYTFQSVDPVNTCGVSMFVPQQVYTDNAKSCIFGDLNEAFCHTAWYKAAGFDQVYPK